MAVPLCFGERLGMVAAMVASREAGEGIGCNDRSAHDVTYNSSEYFHHRILLVDLLARELGDGDCGCDVLVQDTQGPDHPEEQEADDFLWRCDMDTDKVADASVVALPHDAGQSQGEG